MFEAHPGRPYIDRIPVRMQALQNQNQKQVGMVTMKAKKKNLSQQMTSRWVMKSRRHQGIAIPKPMQANRRKHQQWEQQQVGRLWKASRSRRQKQHPALRRNQPLQQHAANPSQMRRKERPRMWTQHQKLIKTFMRILSSFLNHHRSVS